MAMITTRVQRKSEASKQLWPELEGFGRGCWGEIRYCSVLEDGTIEGNTAVVFSFLGEDGKLHSMQTTLNLLETLFYLARAADKRFKDEPEN